MRFAKWVFTLSGIWGIVVLAPLYFMERGIGLEHPPNITHLEFFYGFIGVALAFQLIFFIIGRDPARYRPLMVPSILEELGFAVPAIILFRQGRIASSVLAAGMIDLLLAVLFVIAFARGRSFTDVKDPALRGRS